MVLDGCNIYMQKGELRALSHMIYKINSKWIRDLNVRAENIKFSVVNIGENICDLGLGKDFLAMIPTA